MVKKLEIDFNSAKTIQSDFLLYEKIIKDRGSIYSVSAGKVKNREEIKNFLKRLKEIKNMLKQHTIPLL
ncbi:hypothetical protein LDC_2890 [sediment metagenome]|uniref:Uncharacterized protein n=1 Tax=sediment metagenome TaxID=749907 RepID=D9PMW1_9ZZZZ